MKKMITLIICSALFAVFLGSGIANAADFDITAKSAILVDGKTGQVLFEKDPHKQLPPASITKIMSVLLAMEAIERGEVSLDDMVSVSLRAQSMGGSQIYLSNKDRLPLQDLLKATVVASANDACVAIAEYIGGTEENFVRMMNKRAEELGMKDTHFANTTGLPDENHHTTAYDISLMSRELIKHELVLEWAQIWHETIQLHDRKAGITNTNTLIKSYPDLDGLKTGHTTEAGYCLSATAERDGFRLVSVILNTNSAEERNEASAQLLNYGFRAFEHKVVIKANETVTDLPIQQGKTQEVDAYTADSLEVVVLKGSSDELRREVVSIEKTAPIEKGEKVGELKVYQNEKELGQVDLLATEDVSKANIFIRFLRWIWDLIMRLVDKIR